MGKKTRIDLSDQDEWTKERYMTVDRVGARVSVTRNLGDFNSLTISLSREANADEGESWDDASDRVFASVESKVEEKLDEYNE